MVIRQARRLDRLGDNVDRRIEAMRQEIERLTWWLQTVGIFRACPVPGATIVHDNFGVMVRLPKVPVHRHMGNDIMAPTGTPILAPFDGYASGSRSHLGGTSVRVEGDQGYVYNAHLVGYGELGWVETGDVIGYVGATGDATGPHDRPGVASLRRRRGRPLRAARGRLREDLSATRSLADLAQQPQDLQVQPDQTWTAARGLRTKPYVRALASPRLPR